MVGQIRGIDLSTPETAGSNQTVASSQTSQASGGDTSENRPVSQAARDIASALQPARGFSTHSRGTEAVALPRDGDEPRYTMVVRGRGIILTPISDANNNSRADQPSGTASEETQER